MDEILKITNLSFEYNDKILDDVNLILELNNWYTLVGKNGSGKTTLVKIICGLLTKYDGNIEFNFLDLNQENLYEIRSRMSVLFSNVDDLIVEDNIYDEITFELKNMNYSQELIEQSIDEINEYTHIKDFIERDIMDLNETEKYLLALTSALIIKPKLLIIDETFSKLDFKLRSKLYEIIKDYKKDNKLTILNITHNLEDTLIGDNIILLNFGKIEFNKPIKYVYDNKLLNEENASLPFIIKLSESLKLYDLLQDNCYTLEEMVDTLWK